MKSSASALIRNAHVYLERLGGLHGLSNMYHTTKSQGTYIPVSYEEYPHYLSYKGLIVGKVKQKLRHDR